MPCLNLFLPRIGLPLLAAVVEFYGHNAIKGVTRFIQTTEQECIVDGTLDGLTPGKHGLAICESGDLSEGCERFDQCYYYMRFFIITRLPIT